MSKMQRQIYLLRLTSKPAKKGPREADGAPARSGTATIDLHQCRVGGGASLWSIRMRQCECASRYSDGGVCDYGPAQGKHIICNGGWTMMYTRHWCRATMLTAVFLVASAGGTAFGDETSAGVTILRGTRPVVLQPQPPQEVQIRPPALPSCPDGYVWNLLLGGCYRPRDPLNPSGY